jgi:hypothetical protein
MRLLVIIAIAGMVQVSTGSYAYAAAKAGDMKMCTVNKRSYKCMADFAGTFWICERDSDTPFLVANGIVRCRKANGDTYAPSRPAR